MIMGYGFNRFQQSTVIRAEAKVMLSLDNITPGKIPEQLFYQIARLTVIPVVELLITDNNSSVIILKKRSQTDKYWPGQYCIPGRIISANFNGSVPDIADNIMADMKLKDYTMRLAGIELFDTDRGKELAIIYNICLEKTIAKNTSIYHLCKTDDICRLSMINEHRSFIEKYLKRF